MRSPTLRAAWAAGSGLLPTTREASSSSVVSANGRRSLPPSPAERTSPTTEIRSRRARAEEEVAREDVRGQLARARAASVSVLVLYGGFKATSFEMLDASSSPLTLWA